jgi:polar amino acid transport system substrate-binding protein
MCILVPMVAAQEPDPSPLPLLKAAYLDFPPLTYTDENGQPAGSYVSLTERAARSAGYRVEWTELPVGRIFLQLERGELDLWPGVAGVPRIQPFTEETAARIGNLTQAAVSFRDAPQKCTFTDLAGKRLILVAGYTYLGTLDALKKDGVTDFSYAPNHQAGLGMLERDRGDYFLDYIEPLSVALEQSPVKNLKWCELMKSRLSIVVSRKTLNHRAIIDRLNAGLEENRLLIDL